MFTGIVEGLGEVRSVRRLGRGIVLEVRPPFSERELKVGESVSVNGACLTVARITSGGFEAEVSYETLERTTLGELRPGDKVNIERALRVGDRLGGHFVTGHVDGIGVVEVREDRAEFLLFVIRAPESVSRYLVEKGSVAVDGISLTVNRVYGTSFELTVIPHTASVTTMGFRKPGDRVNLEADILAKYVEKFLTPKEGLGELLKKAGFL